MTILTLVRHGETDWNRDARIQGSTDIPLNDTGRAQAREAGRRLAERAQDAPVVVVSSDMSRAAETADLIAEALGTTVAGRYPGLRERGYGEAEGLRSTDFHTRFGPWHSAEVPGAEAWPIVRQRALAALAEAVADARARVAPAEPEVIAVAHGALIRQVIRAATDEQLPHDGERLPNGSAHTFRLSDDGSLELLSYVGAAA
ncbi:histidine phosphatase family protein [Microbacterium sp. NPDC091313]